MEQGDWKRQDQEAIEAATQKLLDAGSFYGWFQRTTLNELDPISREQMILVADSIVASFLRLAPAESISMGAQARAASYPDRLTHR
jgi:hypothetical protein